MPGLTNQRGRKESSSTDVWLSVGLLNVSILRVRRKELTGVSRAVHIATKTSEAMK